MATVRYPPTQEEADRIRRSSERLQNGLIPSILSKNGYRRAVHALLSNRSRLREIDPRLKLMDELYRIYRALRNDPREFIERVKIYHDQISRYNKALSDLINHINVNDREIPVLMELIGKLIPNTRNPHPQGEILEFLKEHGLEYEEKFAKLGDTETKQRLEGLLAIIGGQEMRYLWLYHQEVVEKWPVWAKTLPVRYFIRHYLYYLNGGDEHLGRNERYMGLYKDFHDKAIAMAFYESKELRRLRHHEQLRQFIEVREGEIERGGKDPNDPWKEFYDFFDNVLGKKGIKAFEEILENWGYSNLPKKMEIVRKKHGEKVKNLFREYPQAWLELLQLIKQEIETPEYILREVIQPAAAFLKQLFAEQGVQLTNIKGEKAEEFRKFLLQKRKEIQESPQKFANELMAHIVKWDKEVVATWKSRQEDFERMERKVLLESARFMERVEEAYTTMNPYRHILNIKQITDSKLEWIKYLTETMRYINPAHITDETFRWASRALTAPIVLDSLIEREQEEESALEGIEIGKIEGRLNQLMRDGERTNRLFDRLMAQIRELGLMEWTERQAAAEAEPTTRAA